MPSKKKKIVTPAKRERWKHRNWGAEKRAYLQGDYATLRDFARDRGISEKAVLKESARAGWVQEKIEIEAAAVQRGRELIIQDAAQRLASSVRGWLDLADVLKVRAVETLKDTRLDNREAIAALKTAVEMEEKVFKILQGQEGPRDPETPAGPAVSIGNAVILLPATATEQTWTEEMKKEMARRQQAETVVETSQ